MGTPTSRAEYPGRSRVAAHRSRRGAVVERAPRPREVRDRRTEDDRVDLYRPFPVGDQARLPYGPRRQLLDRAPRIARSTWVLTVIALILAVWLGYGLWQWTRVDVSVTGIADGVALTPAAVDDLEVRLALPAERMGSAGLLLDGADVRADAVERGGALVWTPDRPLAEGAHTLELVVSRPILSAARFRWSFVVDGTAPDVSVPPVLDPVPIDEPVAVRGTTEPGSTLVAGGEDVVVGEDGAFVLRWERPPAGPPIELHAVDRAGNETISTLAIPVAYPENRSVRIGAADFEDRRAEIAGLAEEGLITGIVLDTKDEAGVIGYDSALPAVDALGADAGHYDLRDAVAWAHDLGLHVTVRQVVFRDPIFADAAWERDDTDLVAQGAAGARLDLYDGAFVNIAHPEVWEYNLDLAIEAAEAGVDDVLFDYIRRPDGDLAEMRFAGMPSEPEAAADVIVEFVAEAQRELRARGVFVGASVFGLAGTEPRGAREIGQDAARMADWLDYMAPMLYPSHYGDGEYNIPVPNEDPYTLVALAVADFQDRVAHRGIPLVPWLQDFSYGGVPYDEPMVRAQIDAACEQGVHSHLLWNPGSSYTTEALGRCP